jgi:hypothetical protein
VKGCSDRAQKLKGSRRKGSAPPERALLPAPAPTLAEYASSDAHSEWVI